MKINTNYFGAKPSITNHHLPGERIFKPISASCFGYQWECLYCKQILEGEDVYRTECPEHPENKNE